MKILREWDLNSFSLSTATQSLHKKPTSVSVLGRFFIWGFGGVPQILSYQIFLGLRTRQEFSCMSHAFTTSWGRGELKDFLASPCSYNLNFSICSFLYWFLTAIYRLVVAILLCHNWSLKTLKLIPFSKTLLA